MPINTLPMSIEETKEERRVQISIKFDPPFSLLSHRLSLLLPLFPARCESVRMGNEGEGTNAGISRIPRDPKSETKIASINLACFQRSRGNDALLFQFQSPETEMERRNKEASKCDDDRKRWLDAALKYE